MKGLSLPTAALVLMLSTPVASHDTGQDYLYDATGDPAHDCHHLRVEYWNDMITVARYKMEILRYHHARPKKADARYGEIVARHKRWSEDIIDLFEDRAKHLGCRPWPPSGGNER